MKPERLIRYRPWLYHLTSRENLTAIRKERRLESAARLLEAAERSGDIREKRPAHQVIEVRGKQRLLRDQQPLYAGNIEFEDSHKFEDVVAMLNRYVFFWPGKEDGPSDYGVRHFQRYQSERPVVIRIRTKDALKGSRRDGLRLCAYNSGAPRCSAGRKSPRGPETFLPLSEFPHGVSRVVEVVVEHEVELPTGAEVGHHPQGPYSPM